MVHFQYTIEIRPAWHWGLLCVGESSCTVKWFKIYLELSRKPCFSNIIEWCHVYVLLVFYSCYDTSNNIQNDYVRSMSRHDEFLVCDSVLQEIQAYMPAMPVRSLSIASKPIVCVGDTTIYTGITRLTCDLELVKIGWKCIQNPRELLQVTYQVHALFSLYQSLFFEFLCTMHDTIYLFESTGPGWLNTDFKSGKRDAESGEIKVLIKLYSYCTFPNLINSLSMISLAYRDSLI